MVGNGFSQRIVGTAGSDVLNGGGGSDQLVGGAGSDTLRGASGATILDGGTGDDIYYVESNQQRIVEAAGDANDTVFTSGSFVLSDDVEIERLSAITTSSVALYGNGFAQLVTGNSGNDLLSGGAGDDELLGASGSDVLVGGAGADILAGGTGDDVYIVDAADTVTENAGQGFDAVYADASFAIGATASIELLATTNSAGTSAIDLTGSDAVQSIYGNAGANVLSGLGGDDYIYGLGGGDTLVGGAGADTLFGGTGSDIFRYDAIGESTAAASDRIIDFAIGDLIDLRGIDANTANGAGDDAFDFIGDAAFSATAGELRAAFENGRWLVQGDVDGDGAADVAILVYTTDSHALTAFDFWL